MNRTTHLAADAKRKLSITITQGLRDRLKREKLERGISINEIMTNALEQYLEHPLDKRTPPEFTDDLVGNHRF
jgi:hypothetical protein